MKRIGMTDDRELVKVTYEILEEIEPLINIVDWTRKSEIQRQIRRDVKKKLRETNSYYNREELDKIAVEIINLAKVHYKY